MTAIFFDLDGTLIDSRADLAATVNHTRKDLGLSPLSMEVVISYVGQGAKYLLSHSIPERANEVDKLWEVFQSHYAEHMLESVTLYPGVKSTLDELYARGFLLGINTAKPAFATRAIIEHFGLTKHFGDAIIAGGDLPELKPSALPLIECAKRLSNHLLSPADWMVGDGWPDMLCAKNAGIKGAFCEFGFGFLKDSPFDAKLRQFDDLLTYVR